MTAAQPHDQPMSTAPIPSEARPLVPALIFIALVVAAVASLGTPLITSVATTFHVSLDSAQWTLTIALLSGAVATPVLGRLRAGPHRRATILATLAIVVVGGALTVLPLPFAWLLVGRAAQGVGLGLTALMMGVARDHLPEKRSAAAIALISVVSIIGSRRRLPAGRAARRVRRTAGRLRPRPARHRHRLRDRVALHARSSRKPLRSRERDRCARPGGWTAPRPVPGRMRGACGADTSPWR